MPARIASVLSDPRFRFAAERAGLAPAMTQPAEELAPLEGPPEEIAPVFEVPPELEAVVLLENRPSLLIRKNRFELPDAGAWAQTLSAHRALIEARLPSVGRIEVDDGGGYWHAGTAGHRRQDHRHQPPCRPDLRQQARRRRRLPAELHRSALPGAY